MMVTTVWKAWERKSANMDEYDEICAVLGMHLPYRVFFDDFTYYITDEVNDVVIGYGDDDLELLLANVKHAFAELEANGSPSWF